MTEDLMVQFELFIRLLQIKTLVLHAIQHDMTGISYETVNIKIIKTGSTSLK